MDIDVVWIDLPSGLTTFIQPSGLIYMSVCGLLNRHCSSLHQPLRFALHPFLSPPGGLGCDLIKRTLGETEGSGCSQRPRSALCWTPQRGDNYSSVIIKKSGTFRVLFQARSSSFSHQKLLHRH